MKIEGDFYTFPLGAICTISTLQIALIWLIGPISGTKRKIMFMIFVHHNLWYIHHGLQHNRTTNYISIDYPIRDTIQYMCLFSFY